MSDPALITEAVPGVEHRMTVHTSERRPVYLVTGRNGSHIRLSEDAHRLLRLRSAGITCEEIAAALSRKGKTVSAAEIAARHQELLDRIERIESQEAANPMGFWFRIRLIPERWVVRLVRPLRAAFSPGLAPVLVALLVTALVDLAVQRPRLHAGPATFWAGYGLLLVSMLVHELGHASACSHYGVRPSDIGATWYLIYPALYSDVSAAWELPRRQRVVVDLGGLYFQFLAGAVFWIIFLVSGWQAFELAYLLVLGGSLLSLNPILKFDGYWVVSDALGVTNLSRQPSRILGNIARRLRGKPAEPLPWSAGTSAVLAVYSVLSFTVWGWFLWRIGPHLWRLLQTLPSQIAAWIDGAPNVTLSSLLMSLVMAGMTVFIGWRLIRSMIVSPLKKAMQRWRQRRSVQAVPPATPTTAGFEPQEEAS